MTESGGPLPLSPALLDHLTVSVIVPALNEAENMGELFAGLAETFRAHALVGEVLFVDDGSTDGTLEAAKRAAKGVEFDTVRFFRHRRNQGKTEALLTAVREARGAYLVLLDADLQYEPEEIPRFIAALRDGSDVVAGRKVGRYDKRWVSGVYNWLSRRVFHVPARDLNAMKAWRRGVVEELHLRHDWHRFLVVLAHASGYRVTEMDIQLHPRRHGEPKYSGSGRVAVGMLDLLSVWFQLVFSRKPMLLFGFSGLFLLASGAGLGIVSLYLRFGLGRGFRPLLNLVLLLVVVGLLLFVVGLLAELIAGLRSEVEELRRDLRA